VKIEAGYDIAFQCAHDVPMLLMLSVHPERQTDLLTEHRVSLSPDVPARDYLDAFGNICTRLVAPGGLLKISNRFIVADSGKPDDVAPNAVQWEVDHLPDETLVYLLGSRYCDTQKLSDLAWAQFGNIPAGWQRVQAICDYVHDRLEFGYHHARSDRTAAEGHEERRGVCRDFAHLAVTLCRCMNIPARYCTGYPRTGRILIGRGRDAADVAISTTFGAAQLAHFTVVTEEFSDENASASLVPNQALAPIVSSFQFA